MRPVALSIEGLTSFRQPQTVDLSDLGLFVITGGTGSGKTSILDAMTLALYGSVCRVKAGELKDLITHNLPAVKVQLDFDVDGQRYRVVRRMRRKGAPEATLERVDDKGSVVDVELPGVRSVNGRIEELLGLDFQAFTKSVLLPQGKFHEFLSGDAEARRTILSRLLELERYGHMGAIARQRAKEITISLEERQKRLDEDYADANPHRLNDSRATAKEAEARASNLAKAVTTAGSISDEVRSKKELAGRLEQDLEPLREVLAELDQLKGHLTDIDERDRATAASVEKAAKTLEEANQALKEATESLEVAVGKHGDEVLLAHLLQAARTIESEGDKLLVTEADIKEATSQRIACEKALSVAMSEKDNADTALVESIRTGERGRLEYELAEKLLQLALSRRRLAEAAKELEHTAEALEKAAAKREQAATQLDHLQTKHRASELQSRLHEGEPCPVCEQMVAALPQASPDLAGTIAGAKSALEAADREYQEVRDRASARRTERDTANKLLEELISTRPAEGEELDVATASTRLSDGKTQLEKAREQYASLVETQKSTQGALEAAGTALSVAVEREKGCERQRLDLVQRMDVAQSQLQAAFGGPPPGDVAAQIDTWLQELIRCRKATAEPSHACDAARGGFEEARKARDDVNRARTEFGSRIAHGHTTAEAAARSLEKSGAGTGLQTLVRLDADAAFAAQLDGVQAFCVGLATSGEQRKAEAIERIGSACREMVTMAQTVDVAAEGLDTDGILNLLQEASKTAERDQDMAGREVIELEKRIEKKAEIEQSMAADEKQGWLHQRIALELQADRFVQFVLGESMRTLAALATSELKRLTGGRYSIEPNGSNFDVIDHENADERRSVATLSGGETFLASLALSLALSGSIRDIAGNAAAARLESMFIDEGFGALDAETVDVAVDALERLVENNRMVGVISHVPVLAERISTGLIVEKVGASSTISRR